MDPLRFGVVGTGMMGCEHLRNLMALPGAEIVAVSDPNEEPRNWARLTLEDRPVTEYRDHRDLLAHPGLDAVVIASPNHTHIDVLGDALATDVGVMVEKPLCTTVADCRRVEQLASARAALTWVGLEYRYMPPVAAFLHEVHSGATGDLKMVFIREHRFPFLPKVDNWNRFSRNTGGTLVEKCCHFFDLMCLATRSLPVRVLASGAQDVNHLDERYHGERPDLLDNAFVIVDFANGTRGCLDLCMFAEGSRNEQELVATGSRGKVEATVPDGVLTVGERSAGRMVHQRTVGADTRVGYEGFHHGASYLELLEFSAALRSGAPPAVTVADGLWSVAMGEAAHRSIDEGRAVLLSEFGLDPHA